MDRGSKPRDVKEESATDVAGYQKRSGFASTRGQDYEVALLCLLFLRALRHASDFFLASNHDLAGKFDDLVLGYRLKGDQGHGYRAILLQAKHKAKVTGEPLTAIFPFRLKEYLESFNKIRNLWKQSVMVGQREITFQEITLVLYTNTGCAIDNSAVDVTDTPDVQHLRDILNTGGRLVRITEAKKVKLPQTEETSDFLAHLLLCTEQVSVGKVDSCLEDELCKVFKLASSNVVARKLNSELKGVMKDWWAEEGNVHYITAQSKEWNQILEMQIRHLNRDTLNIDSRLKLDFTEVTPEEFTTSWMSVKDEYQAKTVRSRLLRAHRNALIIDDKQLNSVLEEITVLWGNNICHTLAVDMSADSPEEGSPMLQSLQEAAQSDSGRRLVIIARIKPPNKDWSEVAADPTWSILQPDTRDRLLETPVTLQGKVVLMREVVGSEVTDVMTDKVITNLSTSETPLTLGTALPAPLQYYVSRCLERISSETINFNLLLKTNALIFSSSYYLPMNEFKKRFKILSLSDIKTVSNIVELTIVRDKCNDYDIRQLCLRFCVRGFSGEISKTGLQGKVKEIIPFTWNTDDKNVVIEGPPGVGKSSFLKMMSSRVKEEFPEAWVLRLDLGRHTDYIKDRDFREVNDIKVLLLKSLRQDPNSLEWQLLEHSLTVTGNVFLFLDAFDEVSPNYTRQCCDLLKGIAQNFKYRQMVVTTRPITTSDVEEALQTRAFTLPVFNEVEQRLFLKQFSEARGKNVGEDEISSLLHTAGTVLQIPLLCRIAAEVLVNHQEQRIQQFVSPWRKVLLYELFVQQTVEDCVAAQLELDISKPVAQTMLESLKKSHFQNLQGLAVRKLMPPDQLCRPSVSTDLPDETFGLIVNTGARVDFEHQTIAEYFLGCWLACHWRECPRELLSDVLFRENFEFVAVTFSWLLFDGFPLHMAVARGDVDAVRALVSAGATDGGGRTALHVAAMTQGDQHEMWELLLASGEDMNKEDDVLGTSCIRYAAIISNWENVDTLMMKKDDRLFNAIEGKPDMETLIQVIEKDLTCMFQVMMSKRNDTLYQFDNEGNTLLHMAAANNSIQVMKLLIERRHKLNVRNKIGKTALQRSVELGKIEALTLLVESGAGLNMKTESGATALMIAALNGHLKMINILLENGADLNMKDEEGWTALCIASEIGYLEVVKILLENGADLNMMTEEGATALILAAQNGHVEIVKILLENGADLNMKAKEGPTALCIAAQNGHQEVVKILLDNGADLNMNNEEGATALIIAAENSHVEIVKILLENGADLNMKAKEGTTALFIAVQNGHLEVVKILLDNGADLNMNEEDGCTALIIAAQNGHVEIVKILLENGADLNMKAKEGPTALFIAAQNGHLEVIKILLDNGADLNMKEEDGCTALIIAAQNGHVEIVKILLENGADVNMKAKEGPTALCIAAQNGHQEVVKILLDNGADLNMKAKEGPTALCIAAQNGHQEVVKILLDNGADLNMKAKEGPTALCIAVQNGHLEVVKILLDNGADLNMNEEDGCTALIIAAEYGYQDVVKILLENGADLNMKEENGTTALIIAAENGHQDVVMILLENGADLNMMEEDGTTALIIAAENGHLGVVKILLENGADVNMKDEEDMTALYIAVQNGHLDVVKILLENGADVNMKDEEGETALIIAAQDGYLEVIKILLEHGADVNMKDEKGVTALIIAAQNGYIDVVMILLEHGADVNMKNEEGVTALIIAAENGNLEIVNILLKNGADINMKAKDGWTAFMLAAQKGYLEVVKILLENGAAFSMKTDDAGCC